jgi:CheY-like chemotaxis protein
MSALPVTGGRFFVENIPQSADLLIFYIRVMETPFILMLEPDADDRYITETFFRENDFHARLEFVADEEELEDRMSDLRLQNDLPSLILLSIRTNPQLGILLIKTLKSKSAYAHIPFVVLSGISDENLVKQCYAAGANSFICKPSGDQSTNQKILNFFQYWFRTVELAG